MSGYRPAWGLPSPRSALAEALAETRALTRVCPRCGARPGERCVWLDDDGGSTGVWRRRPHTARYPRSPGGQRAEDRDTPGEEVP